MNIICSPAGIVNPFRPGQGIMDIVNVGFGNLSLEFDMCCSAYELEHYGKIQKSKEDWEHLKDYDFLPVSEHPSEIGRFYEKMISVSQEKDLQIPSMDKIFPNSFPSLYL